MTLLSYGLVLGSPL